MIGADLCRVGNTAKEKKMPRKIWRYAEDGMPPAEALLEMVGDGLSVFPFDPE